MARLAVEAGPATRAYAADMRELWGCTFPPMLREWLTDVWVETADPYGVELVRAPDLLIDTFHRTGRIYGDCDDVAVLAAALGIATGHAARYVAVSLSGTLVPQHVFAELRYRPRARGEPRWLDMDILRPPGGIEDRITSSMVYYPEALA